MLSAPLCRLLALHFLPSTPLQVLAALQGRDGSRVRSLLHAPPQPGV